MSETEQSETTAEAYLDLLAARGIDYIFGNSGTDFVDIIDAYAKGFAQKKVLPHPILVPHEVTGIAMAHGYTMVSGRPQVVMVHTIPGTANALGGIINASRSNIPMLIAAGRTPLTEGATIGSREGFIHWAQESFDQGSMVREWVKWDYELRTNADLEGVIDRALAIAQSEPAGPVYLTLPREVLAQPIDGIEYTKNPRMVAVKDIMPAPYLIQQTAKILSSAHNPILITRFAGRDPNCVEALIELAELLNIPIFEPGMGYVNFPQSHPLHAGSNVSTILPEADAIIILEADVPWIPKYTSPNPNSTVISIGEDPLYSQYPIRGYRSDLTLAGKPVLTLKALTEAIKKIGINKDMIKNRITKWTDAHKERAKRRNNRAEEGRDKIPIDKEYFSSELAKHIDHNTIILSEGGVAFNQFIFNNPGSAFDFPTSGSLGWGIGASLGAKLAAPEKTVICTIGDGSYIFGSGTAGHIISQLQDLPILFIVWNNGHWLSTKNATKNMLPNGYAASTNNFPFTALSQSFSFEMICQASGGYGECVSDPKEIPAAIERGLHAVNVEKRQALLNIIGS